VTRSIVPRLADIIEAVERIRFVTAGRTIADFKADWQAQWVVERGVEILSEASRHLPEDLKFRHPDVPWKKIAGIGNVIRHDYQRVSPAILWELAENHLAQLDDVCRAELAIAEAQEP
jgi:uncharacterized protein with HEPN domain